jgi:hypothetical protein
LDSNTLGLVGGIAGGVLGVMGGIVGTYFSIKNTNGPKERAFAIRAAILCWFGVSAYLPCLLWFGRWANQRQAGARVEDMTQADLPGHRAGGL